MDFDKLMNYQNMVQSRLRTERQLDRKIEFLSLINQLTLGPNNIVQKEKIIIVAGQKGFSPNEIDDLIDILVKENIIFEPSPGYIKKR